MKNFLLITLVLVSMVSCKSKMTAEDVDKLPKDIALKPDDALAQQQDHEKLSVLIKEIEADINKESCENPEDWKISPIGAKPCGGPTSYIAYPKKIETEILPKIEKLTEMQSAFNKKYNLVSDCMMLMPPTDIVCENGKAILKNANAAVENPQ